MLCGDSVILLVVWDLGSMEFLFLVFEGLFFLVVNIFFGIFSIFLDVSGLKLELEVGVCINLL